MSTLEKHLQDGGGQRAAIRFHVSLPMRFRILGERVWREACAETVSISEVLFRTSTELEAGKGVDVRILLPSPQRGSRGGVIVGKGRVMRCFTVSDVPGEMFVTAVLSSLRLLHGGAEASEP